MANEGANAILAEVAAHNESVAAAGANQGAATPITKRVTIVTAADNAKGVRLPAATVGDVRYVANSAASNRAVVYPEVGEQIKDSGFGAVGVNAAINVGGGRVGIFVCLEAGVWHSLSGITYAGNSSDWDIGSGRLGAKRLQLHVPDTVTATADGLTTGLIPQYASRVTVASDSAAKKISLPAADVGDVVRLDIGATGCMLISAVAGHKANNVVIGATNQLALLANATYLCQYIGTNDWRITGNLQNGSPIAINTAALTTLTIADAAGTPAYSLGAISVTAPFGFPVKQDMLDFIYVVKTLQVEMAELRAALNLTPVAI